MGRPACPPCYCRNFRQSCGPATRKQRSWLTSELLNFSFCYSTRNFLRCADYFFSILGWSAGRCRRLLRLHLAPFQQGVVPREQNTSSLTPSTLQSGFAQNPNVEKKLGPPGIEPGEFSREARALPLGYAGFRPWNAVSNLKDCLCASGFWECCLPLDSCVHSRCQDGLLVPLISIAGLFVLVRSQFMLTAPATPPP